MAQFFALVGDGPSVVRRLTVRRGLEPALWELFGSQRDAMMHEGRERSEFAAGYRPDERELSFINHYTLPDPILAAIANPIQCEPLTMEQRAEAPIKGLFAHDEATNEVLFQVFDRRRLLSTRGFSIILDGDTFRRLEEPGLTLDSKLAAVYSGGRLYFDSFHLASRLLDLSFYYREATDAEIRRFARGAGVVVNNLDGLIAVADSRIRRRIAGILDSGILDQQTPRRIQQAGRDFGLDLRIRRVENQDRLEVPQDKKALKDFLCFLEEDMFKSALTETRYLTNSKRRLAT
jgi:Kiwa KwaB-like protein